MSCHRPPAWPFGIMISLALAACHSDVPVPSDSPAATAGGAMPVDVKGEREEREYREAIEGLSFEGGRVRVETPPAAPDRALAIQHVDAGRRALMGNHRTTAIRAFARAVQAAPDEIDPYLHLARALVTKGRLEHALASFETAIEIDPAQVEARLGLANTLAAAGRRAEAIEAMQAVLRIDPANGPAHERLAVWQYYEGDVEQAWVHVRAAEAAGTPVPPQLIDLLRR